MFNMMATKLFFKFLAFLIPVFLACTAAGLAGLSRHALRGNVEEVTARVGNHAARVAVTLGRHQPDQIGEALAYDLMGSLMSDQAVVCVQWTPAGAGEPALTVPRIGGCGAAAEDNQSVQSVTLPSGRSGAKLTVKFATTEIEQAAQRYFTYSALILLMSALAALVAAGVGFRWVVCKPLRSLRIAIRTGDRTGQPQAVGKKPSDEIGEVIAAYDALVERHRDASESLQRESRQRALEEQRSAFAGKLQSSVEQLRRSLVDIAANLSREVSAMADVSGRLDGAAKGMLGSMSSAQTQSEKNLETAAMAQQLVSGLQGVSQEIETHAINTNMAGEAVNAAGASMQEKLNELERAQNRIASLSGMIAQIASQTNLLALNATIEAARAGEAGRGFAVVASEVKTLALTTAKATIDINAAVSEIGEKLQETRRAGMTFREAGELIAVASGEIKTAVNRQSSSLDSVTSTSAAASEAAAALATSLEKMAELSFQTRAASGSVAEASGAIASVDDALHQAVEKFLNEIAA